MSSLRARVAPTSVVGSDERRAFEPRPDSIRVGVDGRSVSERRTGVGRYVGELLSAAARLAGESVEFTTFLFQIGKTPPDVSDLEAAGVRTRTVSQPLEKAFYVGTRLLLPVPFEMVLPGQDIMFYPNYRRYTTMGKPTVTMIYDLSYLVTPDSVHPRFIRQLRYIAPRAIRRSDVVVTISETMAEEIAAAYPDASSRLRVIPPGPPTALSSEPPSDWRSRLETLGLEPGFLLHVGTLEPRKNLIALINAVSLLSEPTASRHPLVLVGQRGWSDGRILEAIAGAGPRVRHLGYASDVDLRALYAGAALLAFPSRYEGFGLPVLEAMSFGLPVVCSDIPVLREVGGTATVHFDHRDPRDIAEKLRDVLGSEEARRQMAEQGCLRAADYSWERSARVFLQVVRQLADSGRFGYGNPPGGRRGDEE